MHGIVKIMVAILTACFLVSGNDSRLAVGGDNKTELPKDELKTALAPLGRFVGNWEKRFTIFKSVTSQADVTRTGTHSCKWILKERSLEESGQDSDGGSYINIYTWDASTKDYRLFVFRSNGDILHLTGIWNGQTNTFNWTATLYDGTVITAAQQFTTANEIKSNFIAKKADKVLVRIEGTAKRVEGKK